MHINTVTAVHNVLPALATLATGVTRTARKDKRIRLYHACGFFLPFSGELTALVTLLEAGHEVRIYEGDRIYTPALDQGQLVWAFATSRKTRKTVTIEVSL